MIEENIGSMHFGISLNNNVLDMSPQVRETRAKQTKETKKLKNFAQQKKLRINEKGTY